MNKRIYTYIIFWLIIGCFSIAEAFFSHVNIYTSLGILPPTYDVVFSPLHLTWIYTSGPVYVDILGSGIQENTSGIYHNGTYVFWFYRGTWPFITWAGYSSWNTRTFMQTTKTIDRIDDIWPTFAGVQNGITYDDAVSITFTDNYPGATATINGDAFSYWHSITTNGTYQLIVTDAVGHTTWATFIIYLNETPPTSWWTISSGWGGWWGTSLGARELTQNICATRSCYSYYYDDTCGPCTPPKAPVIPSDWPPYHYANPTSPSIEDSSYPKERNDAYLRAYNLWITTVSPIQNAELDTQLLRKFAAKMIAEFAIEVVGILPDEGKLCSFTDISEETPELQYYMRLSCKLGIMGLDYYGDADTVFNPNYVVTRDQFVTLLSRTLFRDTYNIQQGELTFYDKAKNFVSHSMTNISKALGINMVISTPLDWYTKHLQAIKKLWIITNYTLSTKEFKGYVMIIMYRLDKLGIAKVKNLTEKIIAL